MGRFSRWTAYSLQVVLGLMFAFSATMKLTGNMDEIRDMMGVAPWFWSLAGICQAIGVVALLAGLRSARLAVFGGVWIAAVMVGAVITHVVIGDSLADMTSAIALLVLLVAVAALRWREAGLVELLGTAYRDSSIPQGASR